MGQVGSLSALGRGSLATLEHLKPKDVKKKVQESCANILKSEGARSSARSFGARHAIHLHAGEFFAHQYHSLPTPIAGYSLF